MTQLEQLRKLLEEKRKQITPGRFSGMSKENYLEIAALAIDAAQHLECAEKLNSLLMTHSPLLILIEILTRGGAQNPRIVELVRSVVAGETDPVIVLRQIEQEFSSEYLPGEGAFNPERKE